MRKIRVLVVDDSVVVRRMLTDILNADPAIEVVGAAADGAIALAKIPILHPDVITLDVEMPGMSGLDVLAEITRTHTGIPVVMFSASTERAAATTLEALARERGQRCEHLLTPERADVESHARVATGGDWTPGAWAHSFVDATPT